MRLKSLFRTLGGSGASLQEAGDASGNPGAPELVEAFLSVLGLRRLPGGALLREAVCRRLLLMSRPRLGAEGMLMTAAPLWVICHRLIASLLKDKRQKKKKKNHAGIVALPVLKTGKLRSASLEPGDVKGKQGGGLGLEQRIGVLD